MHSVSLNYQNKNGLRGEETCQFFRSISVSTLNWGCCLDITLYLITCFLINPYRHFSLEWLIGQLEWGYRWNGECGQPHQPAEKVQSFLFQLKTHKLTKCLLFNFHPHAMVFITRVWDADKKKRGILYKRFLVEGLRDSWPIWRLRVRILPESWKLDLNTESGGVHKTAELWVKRSRCKSEKCYSCKGSGSFVLMSVFLLLLCFLFLS